MALRPIAFSIPSTTELKVTFSENLSENLTKSNFKVESLNGAIDDLEILGITLSKNIALVKTRPQNTGNYYLLKFLDTDDVIFKSINGNELLRDSISRELFFVGIDTINPIRDRMFDEIPSLFHTSNTTLRNVISAQANEMLRAQISIGEALSNNYISIDVRDEFRTRGPSAIDRMANENAYEVIRVSPEPTSSFLKSGELNFSEFPYFPVSLQQETVIEEEVFAEDGFLISLSKKNIARLLSVKLVRSTDEEDCDGDIGTIYPIDIYKYSISSNYFDQKNAFSLVSLSSNEVKLSEFGNLSRPTPYDKFIVSYIYRDLGKHVDTDTVSVSRVESKTNEAIPTNSTSFFLKNAPIVDASNVIHTIGGVSFKINENSDDAPDEFKFELPFNLSRLPQLPGEFSVNYETGEVFLIGNENGDVGTSRNSFYADYNYRREFVENIDYAVSGQNISAISDRNLINENVDISFLYEKVYAPGTDFEIKSHIERIDEQVENRVSGSFSIKTSKAPITNVYRVFNQTTGEVYNPLYHSATEIFFSGNRSPEISSVENEIANFERVSREHLQVSDEFISPFFKTRITSAASNNSIIIEPGIPAELISENSTDYFARNLSFSVDDLNIRFFGTPDPENLIKSFGISSTSTLPTVGSEVHVGTRVFKIELSKSRIMNKSLDAIGNLTNTSLSFSNISLFSNEKYFEAGAENFIRLRNVGDYLVDYDNGVIYLGVSSTQDDNLGEASYSTSKIITRNANVFSASGAYKKQNAPDNPNVTYDKLSNDNDSISILDLENSLALDDGNLYADLEGNLKRPLVVLDDYTVILPFDAISLRTICEKTALTGVQQKSIFESNRKSEFNVDDILKKISSGGKNLFDLDVISYNKNVIDLKTKVKRRTTLNDYGNLEIKILDPNALSFYGAYSEAKSAEVFDQDLNLKKLTGIKVFSSINIGPSTTSYVSFDLFSEVDTDGDYLLDAEGNRFKISGFDATLSTLTLNSPAENNALATEPVIDYSGENTTIIVKPTITVDSESLTIEIPTDATIVSGELLEISYITDLVPKPSTALAADYSFGYIYVDYFFIKDSVSVSYEYGDNSLDWSINSSINEGDNYYVTYRYGANREALRTNFGSLTSIPFFQNFSLQTDRELYRKALSGVLQSFPKGPTIPAIEGLVETFTDIKPEIDELVFGNWILGRDYAEMGKPDFYGDISFSDGRFGDGLLFEGNTTVSIPSISSLSLKEGTLEGWVRPNWNGIDNDGVLNFKINDIGKEKVYFDPKMKISDNGWTIFDENMSGVIDDIGLGVRLSNYKSTETGVESSKFLLYKKKDSISPFVNFDQKIRIKSDYFSLREEETSDKFTLSEQIPFGTFGIYDENRFVGGELSFQKLLGTTQSILLGGVGFYEIKTVISTNVIEPLEFNPLNYNNVLIYINGILAENGIWVDTFGGINVNPTILGYDVIPGDRIYAFYRTADVAIDPILEFGVSVFSEILTVSGSSLGYLSNQPESDVFTVFVNGINKTTHFSLDVTTKEVTYDSISLGYSLVFSDRVVIFYSSSSSNILDMPEAIKKVILPEFRRPHYLRSCECTINNSVDILEEFNSSVIEIDLGLTYLKENMFSDFNIIDDSPQSIILLDETGTVWDVVGFENAAGLKFFKIIPDNIKRVFVKRFPINDRWFSSRGVDEINSAYPLGKFNLYAKTISPLGKFDKSRTIFSTKVFNVVNHSEYCDVHIRKNIQENLVHFSVKGEKTSLFYHEMIDENDLRFDGVNSIEAGLFLGHLNESVFSNITVFRNRCILEHPYDVSDIYIGSAGFNPKRNPFSISRFDHPESPLGIPHQIDENEGIFLGFDELCRNPVSNKNGAWIFRVRSSKSKNIPVGISISSDGSYSIDFDVVEYRHKFTGEITTDGAFSSVAYSRNLSCDTNLSCSSHFRFCGEHLLEDKGWVNIEESSSELINTILGGSETFRDKWLKIGDFKTSESDGIYRVVSGQNDDCNDELNGNYLRSQIRCEENIELKTSLRSNKVDTNFFSNGLATFSGAISGSLVGITPIATITKDFHAKVCLGLTEFGSGVVALYDGEAGGIIDFASFDWNDELFHEYKLEFDKNAEKLRIYVDELLLIQIELSEMSTPEDYKFGVVELHVIDRDLINVDSFNSLGLKHTIDIDLLEYIGSNNEDNVLIESDDVIIDTDSKIYFEFNINENDEYDSYYDAYFDGYEDYISSDEIIFCSDKNKFFVDTGENNDGGRLSIFKDGKGFLNFRITDHKNDIYNIATNVKDWKSGELHHIGASWKLNSIDEQDEMHLFVDGKEAPNIYRFGGFVPIAVNSKFSDISKEMLYSFFESNIEFCEEYSDGSTLAGSSLFTSLSAGFDVSMIGRSILVMDGGSIAPNLVGEEYVIKSVIGNSVTLGAGENLDTIVFSVSANNLKFSFPPSASNVATDLRNGKFAIYRTNSSEETEELGGVIYEVSNGEIVILNDVKNPSYRANVDSRLIEFVGRDKDCVFGQSIEKSDIDVHIETFGLNLQHCKQKLDLSSTTYIMGSHHLSGNSIMQLHSGEPVSLSDVSIRRIILDKTVVEIEATELQPDGTYLSDFYLELDPTTSKVSSDESAVAKSNNGRYLKVWFESDNVDFCSADGYIADDGYREFGNSYIKIYGETIEGLAEETFAIFGNGFIEGNLLFTKVTGIGGSVKLIDPDYFELGVIGIEEKDLVSESNNGGDACEVFSYQNGNFFLTTVGSSGTYPYELHPGFYQVSYPSYLKVSCEDINDRLFIGTDANGENSWNGVIDEFRIISEKSSDTRSYETYSSGTRSITSDYNQAMPFCPDNQTLALIHFDNPAQDQNRKLRQKVYLDSETNSKYSLDFEKREELLSVVGNGQEFVYKMQNMGFSAEEAEETYYETFLADNGPIKNNSFAYNNYYENKTSSNSVNALFGASGFFRNGPGLLFSNDSGLFRKDEGTIEFWVSPVVNTTIDKERRVYIDIADHHRERVVSTSSTLIKLNNAASEILSVKLLSSAALDQELYSADEDILFDEARRSEVSGRIEGGTGTRKDFSVGHKLSPDGLCIHLEDALPGQNIDVVVSYIPISAFGNRLTVYKNENSQIVLGITANGIDHITEVDVDWKANSWHRVVCYYKTNTKSDDIIRILADGKEGGYIKYGTGIIYGTGYVYAQRWIGDGQPKSQKYKIDLDSNFRIFSIGSDIYGDYSARSRLDNIRFSRIIRDSNRDSLGNIIDISYSDNINTVKPVVRDDVTTFLLDFDTDHEKIDNFITVIDPKNGIFDFDVNVIDNFDYVIDKNQGEIEGLVIDLIDRIKPAHSNALVKFKKNTC